MKVLMIDADGKGRKHIFPNLALMKLSRYHKNKGDEVKLQKGLDYPWWRPDKVYISCVFFQNREKSEELARRLDVPVEIGGSGYDIKKWLSREIEHLMPDYDLYGIDYSMGFTSRGCIRNCSWCIVPEKEGRIRNNAPLNEFLHPDHNKIILLDNNFQASPRWREVMDELITKNIKVNFNQGLDMRSITEEFAFGLALTKYNTWKFNTRRVHFAFDSSRYEKKFIEGFKMLVNNGIPAYTIMVYVLVGFDGSTIEDAMHRVEIIRNLGGDPYIMRFNRTEGPHSIFKHYARYINWRVYKKIESFVDYDYSDSQETIKSVFGDQPPPDWSGLFCSHGAYAWDQRLREKHK